MNYRDLLSGRRRDPLAVLLRGLLAAGEVPYRIVVAARNRRFDRAGSAIARCEVPVISIGNLTTGGTGKTPLVRYVARLLRRHGVRVALVSRGYGSDGDQANDEALELAWALPDVPHLQAPDRVASARIAVEELESQLVLMDDGFQHRRLHRDLDIVVIDATCPFGYEHLLPRGLLREPLKSLRRADVAILSRADLVSEAQQQAIRDRVLAIHPQILWARATHRPIGLLQWPEDVRPLETLHGRSVAVLSAIGNPAAFVRSVAAVADVVEVMSLPDHDPFAPETVAKVRDWIAALGDRVDEIVCTHKDLVKLQTDRLGGRPLRALLIEIQMLEGEAELVQRLLATAGVEEGSEVAAGDSSDDQ